MPHESPSTANYSAVINYLRAKRNELDQTIAVLEALAKIDAPAHTPVLQASQPTLVEYAQAIEAASNASGNNGIGDACARIVRESEAVGPLTTRQVTDQLVAAGFRFTTKSPVNNVWSALDNRSKTRRDVEKVGSRWRYVRDSKGESQAALPVNGSAHR